MANLKVMLDYQSADIELRKLLFELEKHPDYKKLSQAKLDFARAKETVASAETQAGAILAYYNGVQKEYDKLVAASKAIMATLEKLPENAEDKRKKETANLEKVRDEIYALEKSLNEKRAKSEKIISSYRAAQENGKKLKETYNAVKARIDVLSNDSEPKIKALKTKLVALEKSVDAALLKKYIGLANDKKLPPLAQAITTDSGKTFSCSGCGLSLSQSAKAELLKSGLSSCDNCRRMIYSSK